MFTLIVEAVLCCCWCYWRTSHPTFFTIEAYLSAPLKSWVRSPVTLSVCEELHRMRVQIPLARIPYYMLTMLFAPIHFILRSSAHFHCAICAVSKALILSSSLATPGESHIGPSIVFRFSPLPVRREVRSFTPKCAIRTAQLQSNGRYTEGSRVAPKQWL